MQLDTDLHRIVTVALAMPRGGFAPSTVGGARPLSIERRAPRNVVDALKIGVLRCFTVPPARTGAQSRRCVAIMRACAALKPQLLRIARAAMSSTAAAEAEQQQQQLD